LSQIETINDQQQMLLYARDLRRALTLAREREKDLAAAHQRLERLDRLKTDFLMFVSHELRTPLQHLSALELMDPDLPAADLREIQAILRAGYERLNRLVQAGQQYLEMVAESPVCSIEAFDIASYEQKLAARRRGEPRIHVHPPVSPGLKVRGRLQDIEAVEQILVENALRFSEQSPKPVEIQTGVDGERWCLTVRDFGIGFPPELGGELIRPFTVGQIMHHQEGTGLSLARAALLVERAGGRLAASSDGPGLGATFRICLSLFGAGGKG
jgi:signal transduction histidine kinase